jgi:hypothetical protein
MLAQWLASQWRTLTTRVQTLVSFFSKNNIWIVHFRNFKPSFFWCMSVGLDVRSWSRLKSIGTTYNGKYGDEKSRHDRRQRIKIFTYFGTPYLLNNMTVVSNKKFRMLKWGKVMFKFYKIRYILEFLLNVIIYVTNA